MTESLIKFVTQYQMKAPKLLEPIAEFLANTEHDGKLPVIEIFKTLEGEGLSIGKPRVLIRLGGCAVGCVGCDSLHTWRLDTSKYMTYQEIVAEVKALGGINEVSITGGEPLHYGDRVGRLALELSHAGYTTSLETSGQILDMPNMLMFDFVSLDVKTPSSRVEVSKKQCNELWSIVRKHSPKFQLKAIVTNQKDLDFLEANLKQALTCDDPATPLIITPAAGTSHTLERMSSIMDMITKWNKGYAIRIIPQIHVILSFR